MTSNNHKLDLVDINAQIKCGQILSKSFQDIQRKCTKILACASQNAYKYLCYEFPYRCMYPGMLNTMQTHLASLCEKYKVRFVLANVQNVSIGMLIIFDVLIFSTIISHRTMMFAKGSENNSSL